MQLFESSCFTKRCKDKADHNGLHPDPRYVIWPVVLYHIVGAPCPYKQSKYVLK